MKKVCISYYAKNSKNAGPKAKTDIEKILNDDYNFEIVNINIKSNNFFNKIYSLIMSTYFSIKYRNYDIVIIQTPLYLRKFEAIIFKKIKNKILFIHDIEGIRYQDSKVLAYELNYYKNSKFIISHNEVMTNFLIKKGVKKDKIYTLKVFDYLSNNFKENNKKINLNNIKVIYAGNLKKEKCPFIYELNEKKLKYSFNLYGLGIDKELLKKNKKINYRGSFDPENIEFIYGDIGLVWDGHIDESDEDESFKNYTRYNNPHKLSCYIARGLPVIVWRKSAISEFVIKNNIGYTISNLYDINNLDFSDIEEKRKNAMVLSRKLRSGYYTKKIIDEIVEKH